jgi:hypothetical protein
MDSSHRQGISMEKAKTAFAVEEPLLKTVTISGSTESRV